MALAGLAVLLYMVSGVMLRRGVEEGGSAAAVEQPKQGRKKRQKDTGPRAVERSAGPAGPGASGMDPDMADIEEILRRRGIQ